MASFFRVATGLLWLYSLYGRDPMVRDSQDRRTLRFVSSYVQFKNKLQADSQYPLFFQSTSASHVSTQEVTHTHPVAVRGKCLRHEMSRETLCIRAVLSHCN
jgi:hypothetical protein